MTFKKFPSIVQYAGVVKQVRDHCKWNNLPIPTIKFSGSAKIHGTNAGIGFSPDGSVWFQSRENIITYEKDNAGFATWGEQNLSAWKEIYAKIVEHFDIPHEKFYIYGEWYGASIQKGVAVSQLDHKKFGIFKAAFVTGEVETVVDVTALNFIRSSYFDNVDVIDCIVPPVEIEINFENPQSVQNKLLELTLAVEAECPIGKYFGISGTGEGLVWTAISVDYLPKFKTKGEKHSSSKVTTVRELTEAEVTSKSNAAEFVAFALTENRLQQGITKLGEMGLPIEIKSMGAYLKWIGNDILTECHDTLVTSYIERKDVMPKIADKARNWFLNYINKEMGIV